MTKIDDIDKLLPQTQCRDCTYDDCRAYAKAIIDDNEEIHLCAPGGAPVHANIAKYLGKNPDDTKHLLKPKPYVRAVIRESECIGCRKCIKACPVDAIIGSKQKMHTVIEDICTGCELCVEPCPVDCIDLVAINKPHPETILQRADEFRDRYKKHNERLEKNRLEKKQKYEKAVIDKSKSPEDIKKSRQAEILAAVKRAQDKK